MKNKKIALPLILVLTVAVFLFSGTFGYGPAPTAAVAADVVPQEYITVRPSSLYEDPMSPKEDSFSSTVEGSVAFEEADEEEAGISGYLFIYVTSPVFDWDYALSPYWMSVVEMLKTHPNIRPVIVDTGDTNITDATLWLARSMSQQGINGGYVGVRVPLGGHGDFVQRVTSLKDAGWNLVPSSQVALNYDDLLDTSVYVQEYGTDISFVPADVRFIAHKDNYTCYQDIDVLGCGSRELIYIPITP